MRIACIGDLHGSDRWKEALDQSVDHFVFIGDYVDSPTVESQKIISNLKEVISFKNSNLSKVSLLIGNHDLHYIDRRFLYSSFDQTIAEELEEVFTEELALFQVAVEFDDYIFTHGGLTSHWVRKHELPDWNLSLSINKLFDTEEGRVVLAEIGTARGGFNKSGGPFWCDYDHELIHDPLPSWNQVVGHTRTTYMKREKSGGCELLNINYLAYSDNPIYVLEI